MSGTGPGWFNRKRVKDRKPPSAEKNQRPRRSGIMVLEPRMMYDAAAAAAIGAAAHHHHHGEGAPGSDHGAIAAAEQGAHHHPGNSGTADSSSPAWQQAPQTINVQAPPPAAPAGRSVHEIVFIDSQVPDYQALVNGVKPGVTAVVLDPTSDGLTQIADYLSAHPDSHLATIDIVAHATPGEMRLGATTLTDASLSAESDALARIGGALGPNGALMLYGCDVAAGPAGLTFIADLSTKAGGVDVVGATHDLGKTADGSENWTLDAATGKLKASRPFTADTMASFAGRLGGPSLSSGGNVGAFTPAGQAPPNGDPFPVDDSLILGDTGSSTIAAGISFAEVQVRNAQPGDHLDLAGYTGGVIPGTKITVQSIANPGQPDANSLNLSGESGVDDFVANYQAVLRTVTFSTTSASTAPREIDFQVRDAQGLYVTLSETINPFAQPSLDVNGGGNPFYIGGDAPVVLLYAGQFSVTDTSPLSGAAISITRGLLAGDVLHFTDTSKITGSYDAVQGILTLTGIASAADYQAALETVSYSSTADPTGRGTDNSRSIQWQVSAGTLQRVADIDFSVTTQHVPPTVTAGAGAAYIAGGSAVVLDSQLTVNDVDSGDMLVGAKVQVVGAFAGDTLQFNPIGNITGSYDGGSGILTLTGTDTVENYQAALRSVSYNSAGNSDPTNGGHNTVREIYWVVDDGHPTSGTNETFPLVLPVQNDQPTIGLNQQVVTAGIFPARPDDPPLTTADAGGIPLGSIRTFAASGGLGNFSNAAPADGQILPISQSTSLFSILEFTYGGDLPSGTFTLPDLQARLAVGGGSADGTLGLSDGSDTHVVTPAELPRQWGGTGPLDNEQPSLHLNYLINTGGTGQAGTLDAAGEVVPFLGNFAPAGYLFAQGQTLLIADYQTLFNAIGTTYGGDGVFTFKLPDLTDKTIVGAGTDAQTGNVVALGTSYGPTNLTNANLSGQPVSNYQPSLALNYIIDTQGGIFPGSGSALQAGTPDIGEVIAFAGPVSQIPQGWALADGQTRSISAGNQVLFGALGNQFGGNGQTTFNLPDLVGRSVAGVGTNQPDGTVATLGVTYGSPTFTLFADDLPLPRVATSVLTIAHAAPAVTAGAAVTFTIGSATPVALDNTLSLTDIDSGDVLTGATVQISGALTGDVLADNGVGNGGTVLGNITASYDSTSHTLTLSGNDSFAHYQTALQEVTYKSTSQDPSAGGTDAGRTITWTVDDGGNTNSTSSATSTVSFRVPDIAPVVGGAGNTRGYTEQAAAVTVDANLTVTDADSPALTGATVTISGGLEPGDVLHFTSQNGISGVYGAGVLTLTGAATPLQYQAALRSVTFDNPGSDDPTSGAATLNRTIQWQVNDGSSDGNNLSNIAASTITVTAVNDAPVNTVPGQLFAGENTVTAISGLSVRDADAGSASISVKLGASHGTLSVLTNVPGGLGSTDVSGNNTPNVTLTGSQAAIDATLAANLGLLYAPFSNYTGPDTLAVHTSDQSHTGTGGSPIVNSTVAISVGNLAVVQTTVLTNDVDGDGIADPGDTVTTTVNIVNVGGTAANNVSFIEDPLDGMTIVPGTLNVSPIAINDSYPLSIGTLAAGQSVTVTWQATIDPQSDQLVHNPVNQGTVTSSFGTVTTNTVVTPVDTLTLGNQVFLDSNANGTFGAGDTGIDNVALTLFADTDNSGGLSAGDTRIATTVTSGGGLYSFGGLAPGDYVVRVDAGDFAAGGALAGLAPTSGGGDPDNNVDNDSNAVQLQGNVATLPITLAYNTEPTSGSGHDTNTTLDLGFAPDAPPVLGNVAATAAYTENDAPVLLSSAVIASDPDGSTLNGATVSITAGALAGDVLDYDHAATAGTGITVTASAGDTLLTLSGNDSFAHYQQVLDTITFGSTSDDPTNGGADPSRTITWIVNDDVNAASAPQTTSITVTAVNDAPVIGNAGNTIGYTEQAAAVALDPDLTVVDVDNADLAGATVTISDGLQRGDTLHFTNQNGITGSYDAASGVLTLSGSAGVAAYQAALRSVTFDNATNNDPTDAGLYTSRSIAWQVNDGTALSGAPFAATTSIPVGSSPEFVATGDFNGDGKLDLVTADLASNAVSVLLGDGHGGFGPATGFATGSNSQPISIVTGDFNGDGKLDLATANSSAGTVSVLLGDGQGGFGPATQFAAGAEPFSVVTGDFNGDGKLDLVTANAGANTISVLLGDGHGGFGPATDFAFVNPRSIAVGDVNGDGKLDLVAINSNVDRVSVLLGNGSGGFAAATSFATGSSPFSVATGDLNGDGKLDLVTSDTGTNSVSVLLGDGSGGFAAATGFAVGNFPQSVVIGDLNGDGKPDLVTANSISGNVSVLFGDGHGGFGNAMSFAAGSFPSSVVPGDFNGDGEPDLAVVNSNDGTVSILLGTGTSLSPVQHTTVNVTAVDDAPVGVDDVADATEAGGVANGVVGIDPGGNVLTNDTDVDNPASSLRVSAVRTGTETGTGDAGILGMALSGSYGSLTLNADGSYVYHVDNSNAAVQALNAGSSLADTFTYTVQDPDRLTGTAQLVVTIHGANDAPVIGNAGNTIGYAGQAAAVTLDPGLTVVDVDNANLAGATVTISGGLQRGDTLHFTNQSGITGSYDVASGVLALSGSASVAAYQAALRSVTFDNATNNDPTDAGLYTSRSIAWQVNDGTALSGAPFSAATTSIPVGSSPEFVATGDFNGDGKLDLVTADLASNAVSVLLGDGHGGFGPATGFATGSNSQPISIVTGDFNGDGKLDLVTANSFAGTVSVLLGDGQGGFGPATQFAAGAEPFSVVTGDFNGDGKLDLVTANAGANTISVLLGDGHGGFGPATNFAFVNPRSIAVGDVNGDGKLDLVATNANANSVSVLLGNGSGGFAAATSFATGLEPFSVAIGDLNGDGRLDLVTSNIASNSVSVLLGDGSGGFAAATGFAVGNFPQSVVIGDLNGDGKPDLVTANSISGNVSVLFGDGHGGFGNAMSFAVGSFPSSVVPGDFNGDGEPDLAVVNSNDGTVSILLGTGTSLSPVQHTTINVDDAPAVSGAGNTTGYTEQAAAVTLDANLTVTDADSPALAGATVTISSGLQPGDVLHFTSQNGISGVYGGGVLTLTGAATPLQYQAALRSVTFDNASNDDPTNGAATLNRTIHWQVYDASSDGNNPGNIAGSTITVTAVNDAPVNTVPGQVFAGENTVTAISGLSVRDADADSADISVKLSVSHGSLSVLTNVPGGLGSGDVSGNGTANVTLIGSQAAIDATLAANLGLLYAPASNYTGPDTLAVHTGDQSHTGTGGSPIVNSTVAISVGNLAVVQTTVLSNDVDQDGIADPGDTVTTTVNIANVGGTDAHNVSFTEDPLDGMTLVPGTLNVSPIAINDGYSLSGNTPIAISMANGVLANDIEFLGATFGTGAGQTHVENVSVGPTHGNLVLNADGSFTYTPATGFTGTDTFTYKDIDAGGLESTGLVTLTVGPRVWYVDSSASATGADGSFSHPFTSLAAFGTGRPDSAGDTIFVYNRGTAYAGTAITLLDNESLIGDGAPVFQVNGHTLGGNTNVAISDSGGKLLTLGSGNTVRGFDLGNASTDISGRNFGTLTLDHVSINSNGQALNLTSGTFAATDKFTSITSSGGGLSNISMTGVAGTVDLGNGTLGGGSAFFLANGSVSTSYHGDLKGAVVIEGETGGNVLFDTGSITSNGGISVIGDTGGVVTFEETAITLTTGSNDGISLTDNTGASIAFVDVFGGTGLQITTTSGTAFKAIGGGQVSVTPTQNPGLPTSIFGNAIVTTSGTALDIEDTTIAGFGVIFDRISAGTTSVGPTSAIILKNTGSLAGLTVRGDENENEFSGGIIQHTSGDAILLENTQDVTIDAMTIENTGGSAINGTGVTNFTADRNTFSNNGNAGTESAIAFDGSISGGTLGAGDNIDGTLTLTRNTFTSPFYAALDVQGNDGTISSANLSNNTITNPKSYGFNFVGTGTATTVFSIDSATIANNQFTSIDANIPNASSAAIQISVGNNAVNGPAAHAGLVTIDSLGRPASDPNHIISITGNSGSLGLSGGEFITLGSTGNSNARAEANFAIKNNGTTANPVLGGTGPIIQIVNDGFADMAGIVDSNAVDFGTSSGIAASNGPGAQGGTVYTPKLSLAVTNNSAPNGILLTNASGTSGAGATGGDGTAWFKVAGNTVSSSGIRVNAGNASSTDDAVFLDIFGNTSSAAGIGLFKQGSVATTNDFALYDAAGAPDLVTAPNNAEVVAFVNALNPGMAGGTDILGGSNFERDTVQGLPLVVAPGGIEAAPAGSDAASAGDGNAAAPQNPATSGDAGAPDQAPPVANVNDGGLTQDDLNTIVAAAIQRWAATGLSDVQIAYLDGVRFTIADLSGNTLGAAMSGAVTIDVNAAGNGWYIDPTPMSDSEFATNANGALFTTPDQAAAGHVDLLTTVMHELGHELGLADTTAATSAASLMYGTIVDGERRLPVAGETDGAVLGSIAGQEFSVGPTASIGTLPAGKSVTVSWQATIDPQSDQLVHNPSNQGTVTSSFGTVTSNTVVTPVDALTLGDQVFFDANADGTFDAGDTGIDNVALTLFADTDHSGGLSAGDTQIATTVTANGGLYSFAGLAPGAYIVEADASNFAAGGALAGLRPAAGGTDPDNNIDNDSNAVLVSGVVATAPITLAYNTEPTAGNGHDTNNTLDLGFSTDAPPALANVAASAAYTERATPVVLSSGVSVSDPDSSTLNGATVSITSGALAGDILDYDHTTIAGTNITVTASAGNTVLTLSGNDSFAHYQQVLDTITFGSTSHDPTNGGADPSRTVTWIVNDDFGATSAAQTTTVTITSVDDAPALTVAASAAYTENATPTTLDSGLVVSDLDGGTGYSATVQITGGSVAGDQLIGGGTWDAATQTFTTNLAANATLAALQADLRTLAFSSTSDDPGATPRTLTWTISDGSATSTTTSTVNVTPVNDAPVITVEGPQDIFLAGPGGSILLTGDGQGGFTTTAVGQGGFAVGDHLAIGDLNGDGIPDVVVTADTAAVGVLLGDGMGGFTASTVALGGGASAAGIAIGDINGDGKADIVVATPGTNNISILLGNGAGGFTVSTQSIGGGGFPEDVAIGDVNGDGKADIVTANLTSSNVSILIGDGAGHFTATTTGIAGGSDPVRVVLGDVDNDHKLDIVTLNAASGDASVLIGDGLGGFTATRVGLGNLISGPEGIALGDVDGDGNLDIVTANFDHSDISVALGDGHGGFTASRIGLPAGATFARSIAVGDFNGDGKLDLVAIDTTGTSSGVALFIGDGHGGFTASNLTLPANSFLAAVGVANLDNTQVINEDTTLLFGHAQGNAISIADVDAEGGSETVTLSAGHGSLTLASTANLTVVGGNGSANVTLTGTLADINAALDGLSYLPDLNYNGRDTLTIAVDDNGNSGGPPRTASTLVPVIINPVNDAPVLDPSKTPVLTAENEDSGWPSGTVGTLVSSLVDLNPPAGGLDNVTDVDNTVTGIALTATDTAHGSWYYSLDNGTTWNAVGAVSDGQALLLAADAGTRLYFEPAANFNGTLSQAITFRAWDQTSGTAGSKVDSSVNGGATAFSAATDTAALTVNAVNDAPVITVEGPQDIFLAGLDGDTLLTGDGQGGFTTTAVGQGGFAVGDHLAIGDLNGDGIPDVVVTADTAAVGVLLGDGMGGFTASTVALGGGASAAGIAIGDINGDGKADIVVATPGTNNISILLGNGAGGFTVSTQSIGGGGFPEDVAIGDVNGDGKADIVTANLTSSNVSILIGDGAGHFTATTTGIAGGSDPVRVVLGDVDNDHKLDIVTLNAASGDASVLIGDGLGGFTATRVGLGNLISGPEGIALGDVDGDGNLDIVTANFDHSDISVALGDGHGGFTASRIGLPAGATFARSIAVGDFNGDGKLDLVAIDTTGTSSGVALFIGDGHGGFTASNLTLPANSFLAAVGVANLDNTQVINEDTTLLFGHAQGNAISIADVDAEGGSETVTLSAGHGSLTLASTANLTVVGGNGSANVTLTGTLADINAALDGLSYLPDLNYNGRDTLTIAVDDNGNSGGPHQTASTVIPILINPVNDAPALTVSASAAYTENAAPTTLDSGLVVSDVDGGPGYSATVQISGGFVAGDQLIGGGTYDPASHTFTTSGYLAPNATLAALQADLQTLAFSSSSHDSGAGPRTLTWTISDGSSANASFTTITAVDVMDAPLTAQGLTLNGVEGVSFNATVATFIDSDPNGTVGGYTATIDWGDGTPTSAGTVSVSNGIYSVTGSHTYAEEGPYTATATIHDAGGATAVASSTATIADAALFAQALTFNGVEGAALSATVATFTDANPGASPSDFTATIDWGDGTTSSPGTVSVSNGVYSVAGSHTYAEERTYTATATIRDDGGSTATARSAATVVDAPLTVLQSVIASGDEGVTPTDLVVTFTDADPNSQLGDFTATINWGDGTASTGAVVTFNNGVYSAEGLHTYLEEGSYTATATVTDAGGSTATSSSTATIADAPLTAVDGPAVKGAEGASLTTTVATFTDGNPLSQTSDFTATIAWGDGATSAGTVSVNNGVYSVAGTHTYLEEGSYTATATITDDGGSTATASSTATVADAPLTVLQSVITSGDEGVTPTDLVVTFTDADPNSQLSDFTATINWGDGTAISAGAVSVSNGVYSVEGAHTYFEEGPYTVTATIADAGGATATVTGDAVVRDAPLTAQGSPILNGIAGSAVTATVATFTDANPNGTVAEFTATVDWGDGTTSSGVVAQNGGGFAVTGSHAYAVSGVHTAVVAIADAGGSTAKVTDTLDILPTAPDITSLVGTPLNGQAVELRGSGEAGDTVFLYADGNTATIVGTGTVNAGGTFDITTTTTFADGVRTFTATQTDAANLLGAISSPAFTANVEPDAPLITAVVGQPVNGGQVELQGTGEVGETVNLYADGNTTTIVGTGTVGADGTFDITTTATFNAGAHTFTATETDAVHLTGPASTAFTVNVNNPPHLFTDNNPNITALPNITPASLVVDNGPTGPLVPPTGDGGGLGFGGNGFHVVHTDVVLTTASDASVQISLALASLEAPLGGDVAYVVARQANGDPLPDWLKFDPATGTFAGLPPDNAVASIAPDQPGNNDVVTGALPPNPDPGIAGPNGPAKPQTITVEVLARDSKGNIAVTVFTIDLQPHLARQGWNIERNVPPFGHARHASLPALSPEIAAIEAAVRDVARPFEPFALRGMPVRHGDAITVGSGETAPAGRPGLTEQLASIGWRSMAAQRDALLASLLRDR